MSHIQCSASRKMALSRARVAGPPLAGHSVLSVDPSGCVQSPFEPGNFHRTYFQMYEKGKNSMGKNLRLEIEEMWTPLREIQAEDAAITKSNADAGMGTEYAV